MSRRFAPGDHLQVQRPRRYFHHGIYVSDDRVIQFGSGVTLRNKGDVGIDAVPLKDFEQGGTAKVVRHGYESWFTGHHPAADEGWKAVARAEFLLKLQPKLPYHLIGHNCEIVANMCVSGSWTESYQVRRFFGARAYMDGAFLIWLASRSRTNKPLPKWMLVLAAAIVVASLAAIFTYNDQIKQLWQEIRDDWLAHERMLAEDPRNGQTP
ncbi:MAG TPA: lecithin retinol acyltransferase family protein [Streptosporangiaceae bacterium]